MAARRLLAAMLVFLAISTVLAALAPRPIDSDREGTTTTQTTGETTRADRKEEPERGALVRRHVRLKTLSARPARRLPTIEVHAGDQLELTVSAPRAVTLESASLGITETAGPDDPARFNLFLTSFGRHVFADAESGRRLLRIEVEMRIRRLPADE